MTAELDVAPQPWPDQENLRTEPRGQVPRDVDRAPEDRAPQEPGPFDKAHLGQPPFDHAPHGTGADSSTPVSPIGGADSAGPASGPGADQARVIRPATAPAPRPPAEDEGPDEAEHYIPPPPPPLPHLDPMTKGAWAALLGGPAYLLVASIAGWVVPGWAALGAVAAFIGGFTVIVLRLGDGPSRGAGPDNGAVL